MIASEEWNLRDNLSIFSLPTQSLTKDARCCSRRRRADKVCFVDFIVASGHHVRISLTRMKKKSSRVHISMIKHAVVSHSVFPNKRVVQTSLSSVSDVNQECHIPDSMDVQGSVLTYVLSNLKDVREDVVAPYSLWWSFSVRSWIFEFVWRQVVLEELSQAENACLETGREKRFCRTYEIYVQIERLSCWGKGRTRQRRSRRDTSPLNRESVVFKTSNEIMHSTFLPLRTLSDEFRTERHIDIPLRTPIMTEISGDVVHVTSKWIASSVQCHYRDVTKGDSRNWILLRSESVSNSHRGHSGSQTLCQEQNAKAAILTQRLPRWSLRDVSETVDCEDTIVQVNVNRLYHACISDCILLESQSRTYDNEDTSDPYTEMIARVRACHVECITIEELQHMDK